MKTRYVFILILVSFLLHLLWENAQAPLYAGYQSFSQHFSICFVGAIGDVIITLFALAFMRLLKKEGLQTIADYLTLAIIGLVVAVLIEQNALLVGKWSYASAMPIVPWIKIGLMPIIQMTILLPLSFYLAELFNKKFDTDILKRAYEGKREFTATSACGRENLTE